MQFDVIIGNPPYQMKGGSRWFKRFIHLPFICPTGAQFGISFCQHGCSLPMDGWGAWA
ncbi:MAG: Eco57I restriction-modification methylase domain-containing protein [Deltaproteobacteria bacterium]|nr:Eco57I restriction-modification methylase domain-containing protein [Deltaproteobacteria bacterium]